MAQYNYQTGYPLNLEAGSTEKPLSAFQKVKAEFERLYRLLNSGLSTIDQLASQISSQITSIESLANSLRTQVQNALNSIDGKLTALKAELKGYIDGIISDAGITGNCTVTVVQSDTHYTCTVTELDGTNDTRQIIRVGYNGTNHTSTFTVKYGSTITVVAQFTTDGSNTVTPTQIWSDGGWRYAVVNRGFTSKFQRSNTVASNVNCITVLEPITITGLGIAMGEAWEGAGGGGGGH